MSRVKRGVTSHARHRKVIKQAKGYYGRRKNTIRVARQAVEKAGQYAYRDRKVRKRTFRALWIQRINAAARGFGGASRTGLVSMSPKESPRAVMSSRERANPGAPRFAGRRRNMPSKSTIPLRLRLSR